MSISYETAAEYINKIGLRSHVASNVVLVQKALERGIDVSRSESGRSFVLKHGSRSHWWRGGNSSLNSQLAKRVSQYKSATNALLATRDIATTRSFLFDREDEKLAWQWAQKFSSVVIKPNDGQGGKDVHLDISDETKFHKMFQFVAKKYNHVLVEPYFVGEQIRCLMVDYELAAAAHMRPASVVGDGTTSLKTLITQKNKARASHPSHEDLSQLPWTLPFSAKQTNKRGDVPAPGERVFLSNVSNLQRGGDSVDITETIPDSYVGFAKNVVQAMPGMRLAGVDIILTQEGKEFSPVVLEINTSPQLSIHHFPWEGNGQDVASKVLDAMFPQTKSASN